jgi:NitT/TauT family transport system permease protein
LLDEPPDADPHVRWCERGRLVPAPYSISPFLVASQAVPIVAIAPLLIIWFGSGIFSKVLICALIVFFPVLVNTIVGIRAVPRALNELMRSLRASRWQILWTLEIPAALPVFLGGLRIGATLSVIGAVVGEFVGADRGLGFLINVGRGQYDTALVFVAIFTLIALALSLYGLVLLLEKRLLAWQDSNH